MKFSTQKWPLFFDPRSGSMLQFFRASRVVPTIRASLLGAQDRYQNCPATSIFFGGAMYNVSNIYIYTYKENKIAHTATNIYIYICITICLINIVILYVLFYSYVYNTYTLLLWITFVSWCSSHVTLTRRTTLRRWPWPWSRRRRRSSRPTPSRWDLSGECGYKNKS